MTVSFIAIRPFPCSRYLCPGSTPSALLDSGAPSRIAGMTFMMLCVTASDTIKGVACCCSPAATARVATRFTCTPGMRPVKQPASTPSAISMSMYTYRECFSYVHRRFCRKIFVFIEKNVIFCESLYRSKHIRLHKNF